ncbi:MAG TPA: putative glycoside hydrolase [Gemmatimonadales bacterium]
MRSLRQCLIVLGAALAASRGLAAQEPGPETPALPLPLAPAADHVIVLLRGVEPRYALPEPLLLPAARAVKALYVNAWAFGSPKLRTLIELADSTEINAFVIDVKDDSGCLLYPSAVKTAQEVGATLCVRAKDARARLDTLRAHGIYTIARIVVAKDPLVAEHKVAWSVRDTAGELWRDRIGSAWVDAYNDSVWIYAAQLAEEAVHMGFAEVQFDYVRFPDEPHERLMTALFPGKHPGENFRAGVRRNVTLLKRRLAPLGVPVTFDVFGLTVSAEGDLGIGQVWEDFTSVADVILPMVYPSHYYPGAYGYSWPNGQPYEIVRHALREALQRTTGLGAPRIRPYLQAFTLGRRKPRYTPFEIREEIRAAEELGIDSWVLWNPRSVYQRDCLRPYRAGVRFAQSVIGGVE